MHLRSAEVCQREVEGKPPESLGPAFGARAGRRSVRQPTARAASGLGPACCRSAGPTRSNLSVEIRVAADRRWGRQPAPHTRASFTTMAREHPGGVVVEGLRASSRPSDRTHLNQNTEAEMFGSIEGIREARRTFNLRMFRSGVSTFRDLEELEVDAFRDGALDQRSKELIALGISICDAPQWIDPRGFSGHARPIGPRYAPMGASHPKRSCTVPATPDMFYLIRDSGMRTGNTSYVKVLSQRTTVQPSGPPYCYYSTSVRLRRAEAAEKPALSTAAKAAWLAAGCNRSAGHPILVPAGRRSSKRPPWLWHLAVAWSNGLQGLFSKCLTTWMAGKLPTRGWQIHDREVTLGLSCATGPQTARPM